MEKAGTPYRKSFWLYFQNLAFGFVLGPAMAYGGYYMVQTSEIVIVVIGAMFLLAGPMIALAMPFMGRPGWGECPSCGGKIYNTFPSADVRLLCPKCAAYTQVMNDRLVLVPLEAMSDKPMFAAALPWNDIAGAKSDTIAFSAQDVIMDKLNAMIAGKEDVRVIDRWPDACCVCRMPATRHDDNAVQVLIMGRMRETYAPLLAKGVPYCAEHKDGIAFKKVDFATPMTNQIRAFGILFRNHAYREAFRKLNPWKFLDEAEGPVKIRKSKS